MAQDRARFVAYYRVSTAAQGRSGLGLEAQVEAVKRHVAASGGVLVRGFEEVESGTVTDRPQLGAALAACRGTGSTLLVAKLDRLARNVAFIANLMEAGVDFQACDLPAANRLTLHIMSAMAEFEREQISTRTKAALAAAKARRVRLGNPRLAAGNPESAAQASRANVARAQRKVADVLPVIEQARAAGALSLRQLAEALTNRGIRTPAGKAGWSASQVRRVLARASA